MRINKYIAASGICSRRAAELLITQGRVMLNGKIINELGIDVLDSDEVKVDGKAILPNDKNIYLVMNKPKGYITTSKDQFGRPCIMDLIKNEQRVYPVGRLDMDTEGIIILTNDGEFSNKVIHPRNKITKTYVVKIKQQLSKEQLEALAEGVDIGGYITKPAKVRLLNKDELEIKISEGKNRQIRKMCEAVSIIVYSLKRTAIGELRLDGIQSGKYIKMEKEAILNKIGIK